MNGAVVTITVQAPYQIRMTAVRLGFVKCEKVAAKDNQILVTKR